MTKRVLDILFLAVVLPLVMPLFLITWALVKLTSQGPALYWSKRVGQHNQLFFMPKFRSMYTDTPVVATHVLNQQGNAKQYLTPVGAFIRKTSLDELPQFLSVLKGDMSVIGPRPALFNQNDLIELRTRHHIHEIKPGITGWAQVNGRDEIPIVDKVSLDYYYLNNQSILLDCKVIFLTILKVIKRDDVSH